QSKEWPTSRQGLLGKRCNRAAILHTCRSAGLGCCCGVDAPALKTARKLPAARCQIVGGGADNPCPGGLSGRAAGSRSFALSGGADGAAVDRAAAAEGSACEGVSPGDPCA